MTGKNRLREGLLARDERTRNNLSPIPQILSGLTSEVADMAVPIEEAIAAAPPQPHLHSSQSHSNPAAAAQCPLFSSSQIHTKHPHPLYFRFQSLVLQLSCSGRILKTGMASRQSARTDVLGSGTGLYGHGNIMRGGSGTGSAGSSLSSAKSGGVGIAGGGGDLGFGNVRGNVGLISGDSVKRAMMSMDPEEVKRMGSDRYERGNFAEALGLYDRAIALSPRHAAYRSNRAAVLTALGRLPEAVRECEEAVRLEPGYARAHHRLGSLLVSVGYGSWSLV